MPAQRFGTSWAAKGSCADISLLVWLPQLLGGLLEDGGSGSSSSSDLVWTLIHTLLLLIGVYIEQGSVAHSNLGGQLGSGRIDVPSVPKCNDIPPMPQCAVPADQFCKWTHQTQNDSWDSEAMPDSPDLQLSFDPTQ